MGLRSTLRIRTRLRHFLSKLGMLLNRLSGGARDEHVPPLEPISLEAVYCGEAPSNQTIVDIFKGNWFCSFPEEYGVKAGPAEHFDFSRDPRVKFVSDTLNGGVEGLSILELGPYEAYHTWQLQKLGAGRIISIEANNLNYLKCLLVKEITGLNARFLYGDFIRYLETCHKKFDIVWASGVLYHQKEPLKLLDLMTRVANRIFVWTHYYDEKIIYSREDLAALYPSREPVEVEIDGFKARLYSRNYNAKKVGVFSGGSEDDCYWMPKEDILGFLRHRGFTQLQFGGDDPKQPNGPAMYFLASRH